MRGFRQLLQLCAGNGPAVLSDSELLGDHCGGARVITRNHQRPYPGAFGPRYSVLRLFARRIDHANQTREYKVPFDARVRSGRVLLEDVSRQPEAGDAESPQCLAGECFVDLQNLFTP